MLSCSSKQGIETISLQVNVDDELAGQDDGYVAEMEKVCLVFASFPFPCQLFDE